MRDTLTELSTNLLMVVVYTVLIFLSFFLIPISTVFRFRNRFRSEKCPRCRGRYRTYLIDCRHTYLQYCCYYCGNGWAVRR